jgi:hypothetical protein
MTMKVGRKILAAAALALVLSQAACGGKPQPRPVYDEAFVNNLLPRLHSEDAETRFVAVRALGNVRHVSAKKAIPAIQCMLGDENRSVAEEAERALRKLDPSAGELVLATRKNGSMQ